jgi:2-keto-4-pentenoate hydratase/2-oxohepta-3-ene-1,7-dioic acid hydratase in catechol pathway
MKIVRFTPLQRSGPARLGVLLGDGATVLDVGECGLKPPAAPNDAYDLDGNYLRDLFALVSRGSYRSYAVIERAKVRLLAPIERPGKVICVGLNYRDHAVEAKLPVPEQPVIFTKFPSCVIGPDEEIVLPPDSQKVDYEAELAFVVGRRASQVDVEDALEHVLGYTCVNDVSARDFQFQDVQWTRGKSCDTFCPLGEAIVTTDELRDPHDLRIRLHLNGATLQDSRTDQLVFGVPQILSFLSRSFTLEPGDVIATGTPPGVGFARKPPVYLKDGDEVIVEIEGVGRLRNTVRG